MARRKRGSASPLRLPPQRETVRRAAGKRIPRPRRSPTLRVGFCRRTRLGESGYDFLPLALSRKTEERETATTTGPARAPVVDEPSPSPHNESRGQRSSSRPPLRKGSVDVRAYGPGALRGTTRSGRALPASLPGERTASGRSSFPGFLPRHPPGAARRGSPVRSMALLARGQGPLVEVYLQQQPEVRANQEAAAELIYSEFLVRAGTGPAADGRGVPAPVPRSCRVSRPLSSLRGRPGAPGR